jgi:hypothetical protein
MRAQGLGTGFSFRTYACSLPVQRPCWMISSLRETINVRQGDSRYSALADSLISISGWLAWRWHSRKIAEQQDFLTGLGLCV